MTTTQRWVAGGVGLAAAMGLAVVAVLYGRDGIDLVSSLAGIGSFVLALIAVVMVATPPASGLGKVLRFSANARGSSTIIQAGGNVTNAGNRRR